MKYNQQVYLGYDRTGKQIRKWFHADTKADLKKQIEEYKLAMAKAPNPSDITFGKYWIPTFIELSGIPVVFGPVGGGEETPAPFRQSYSFRGRLSEWAKRLAVSVCTRIPSARA